jgi:hypothetical protein
MWKNMLQPDMPHTTVVHAHCLLDKSRNNNTLTHVRMCVTLNPAFPWQKWLCERNSLLRSTYTASLSSVLHVLRIQIQHILTRRYANPTQTLTQSRPVRCYKYVRTLITWQPASSACVHWNMTPITIYFRILRFVLWSCSKISLIYDITI